MKKEKDKRLKGLYLVVDPSMDRNELLYKVRKAVGEGIRLLQIWDYWQRGDSHEDIDLIIRDLLNATRESGCAVIINNRWEKILDFDLDGVHFDVLPENMDAIRERIGPEAIVGVTCGNDRKRIREIAKTNPDYISFCSMFPSSSAESCEMVNPQVVEYASKALEIPIFLSGGIHPENLLSLNDLDFDGIAVISGIMDAPAVETRIRDYRQALKKRGEGRH